MSAAEVPRDFYAKNLGKYLANPRFWFAIL